MAHVDTAGHNFTMIVVPSCRRTACSQSPGRVVTTMEHAAQVLVNLAAASNSASNPAALRSSVAQDTVVGLFRDLRGITMATNSRRTYGADRLRQDMPL
jgi:hypothetical protein